jgi:hypothetical protein
MKISAGMTKSYPKIAKWICDNLPKVKTNTKVFNAFMKYSEQNTTVATQALTAGNNPTIDFRAMIGANGEFEGSTFPETVFLAKDICEKFENSPTDAKDKRMHVLIESTILHEMVHWGDWKDGVDQPGEEGKEFEKAAYGKDIDRYW